MQSLVRVEPYAFVDCSSIQVEVKIDQDAQPGQPAAAVETASRTLLANDLFSLVIKYH